MACPAVSNAVIQSVAGASGCRGAARQVMLAKSPALGGGASNQSETGVSQRMDRGAGDFGQWGTGPAESRSVRSPAAPHLALA